ncbi:hypothetical protein FIBSPDRAFT_885876 [Athelia psychrophila]|uniref:RNase H type-1 domain-containing protein n=1 Tax=Athelia psychrophila TaxID=1759441 RepID=A0A166RIG2_9AGAM|nr:hypothetical protein FIBSPDRAFT_885876 [Fibularhizoctonia sp. CBS 109695]
MSPRQLTSWQYKVYGWAVTLTVAEEGMNHSDHRAILVTLKALTLIHVTPVPHSSNMVIRPVANFVDEGPLSELDLLLSHVLDSNHVCTHTPQVQAGSGIYWNKNLDILQDIVLTLHNCHAAVKMIWVPGHSGNVHNDGANKPAKEGALK